MSKQVFEKIKRLFEKLFKRSVRAKMKKKAGHFGVLAGLSFVL